MDVLFAADADVYKVKVVVAGSVRYSGATCDEDQALKLYNAMIEEYDRVKNCEVTLYQGETVLYFYSEGA